MPESVTISHADYGKFAVHFRSGRVVCIDLKDAYFHVPIVRQPRQFLRFAYRGQHWQFRVLPFGLSLSLRLFTRCMAAALAPLQSQGMKILPYLEDWLICAPSRGQVIQDTSCLLSHVAVLGLKVNLEKSYLNPSQTTTFIAIALDTTTMLALPVWTTLSASLLLFECACCYPMSCSCISFGKLTPVSTVVPLGLLSLRLLQRWLNSFHLYAKWHRYRRLRVSQQCLLPWLHGGTGLTYPGASLWAPFRAGGRL